MDDRILDNVFKGCLKGVPEVNSKIVRIFTSSTFTGELSLNQMNIILIAFNNI